MTRSTPLKILGWSLAALLALIALLVIFVLTFDWNRARPYINQKVSESTGRSFVIEGDLQVKWKQGLKTEQGWRRYVPRPVISAQDVRMSNPDWATAGPQLASAKRIDLALHPLPLLQHRVVLTDLALEAPNIALQRRADGSNSWTLKDNGPSPWEVEIQRMAFGDGTIRYLDEGIALDLRAKVSSTAPDATPDAVPNSAPVEKYGIAFTLGGSYRKAPVTGGGKAGAVLSLTDNNTVYPVQAHAVLGKNKASIAGTLTDPRALSGIDLQLSLAGASMADLYPLTGVLLPETPDYATKGRLLGKKDGASWTWTYQNFKGTVGQSDLAGTLQYLPRQPRPLLRGEVTSQQLRLEDLGPTIGADSNAQKQARGKAPVQPDSKALPVEQFNTAKWNALDADVKFTGKKLVRTHDIPFNNVVANIHMKDKVLSLTPLNFGMAGGDITSNITLDGRQKTIAAQAKVAARHLKIRELFPKLQSMQASFGEVYGDAALTGHGNSVSAMLASANGELAATVSEGSVSQFMLELAGLNLANAVFVKIFGDKQVHLNCLASDFSVTNGQADVRRFVLDTDTAVVNVTGNINLASETLDLDVRPRTKGARIITLRTPLYAKGTFKNPDVGPQKGPLALKAGAAVALATIVTPLAALLPLVNIDKAPDTDCAAVMAQANATRKAPTSPATHAPAKKVSEADIKKAQQEKK
ncbi:MAG: AsmA family protein [Janthinobacterium svalbardensis]|uniref:AsmA family protein n=1 Tax=Janthinobacterium svalbardensis TaxID=368607 RepID=A0A290WSK1_9BURK|nr:AsmA family protein [Janthinobacterium svalbardensis]ATD59843.1 AsmA family protein [Janthinobacterium svalbardensis]